VIQHVDDHTAADHLIAAELEDARTVAHEVADIEANPDAGVPHEGVLDWLIAQGTLTREAVDAARRRHAS
jgi:hypothetical protein